MKDYYKKRANEYEKVHTETSSSRKEELAVIAASMQESLKNKRVLEVACGTGYWTETLSHSAKAITATDAVEEVLDIAKAKAYSCPVSFQKDDAYNLSAKDRSFDAGLANFWISHVPKSRISEFLEGFHSKLERGSTVFLADNVYVPGLGGDLLDRVGEGDSYKNRKLEDGTEHVVLKNYYSKDQLKALFAKNSIALDDKDIFHGKFYWFVSYQIP